MQIIDVWKTNLFECISAINKIIKFYNYVSMDTEFPGIVVHPFKLKNSNNDEPYKILKSNVDLLDVIQIGFTFSNEEGLLPKSNGCWQFNFYFDIDKDLFAQDSMDLLINSGVNFYNHKKKGIKMDKFAYFLINSGLVLNKKIKWISFHSGYDFGYLIKILTNNFLPPTKNEFFKLLQLFFPCSYDMKYLGIYSNDLYGGLNKLADKFNVPRIGPVHQAGSDSLLTLKVFFKLRDTFFNGKIQEKHQGILYGLGSINSKKKNIESNNKIHVYPESLSKILSQLFFF
mmetsp:Transcript_17706/g.44750  ORF Transcript_17706/g.44750 Transcript_17706/m.44750 type:complete len:286 (-) Transcript_17706:7-864(-)